MNKKFVLTILIIAGIIRVIPAFFTPIYLDSDTYYHLNMLQQNDWSKALFTTPEPRKVHRQALFYHFWNAGYTLVGEFGALITPAIIGVTTTFLLCLAIEERAGLLYALTPMFFFREFFGVMRMDCVSNMFLALALYAVLKKPKRWKLLLVPCLLMPLLWSGSFITIGICFLLLLSTTKYWPASIVALLVPVFSRTGWWWHGNLIGESQPVGLNNLFFSLGLPMLFLAFYSLKSLKTTRTNGQRLRNVLIVSCIISLSAGLISVRGFYSAGIPLTILAATGLQQIKQKWIRQTTIYAIALTSILALTNIRPFITPQDVQAMQWLSSQPGTTVLSDWDVGSAVPYFTNKKNYCDSQTQCETFINVMTGAENTSADWILINAKKWSLGWVRIEKVSGQKTFIIPQTHFIEKVYGDTLLLKAKNTN